MHKNDELTIPPLRGRSYAYCSDTRFFENIIPIIKNVDILYHEATYLHEMKARAVITGHSTALEAGMIADKANAGRLIIGHFSSRYKDLDPLLEEARSIFPETYLAEEGAVTEINQDGLTS